ncbi:MAG: hypothetical protein ACPGSW_04520 [Phaeobacter italicus]
MTAPTLKSVLATVAPTLATALGGPLAGVATKALADKLLGDPAADFDAVQSAVLQAGPADLVRLKELDVEFKRDIQAAGIKLEEIAASDRDSARRRQTASGDRTPAILGLCIVLGFFGVLFYIFQNGLPEQGSEVLLIMVGSLGTMTTQVGNYFFGSSVGSKTKDRLLADLKAART